MTDAARSIASEEGLLRFQVILAAIDIWRDRLTPAQKRLIREGGGTPAKVTAEKLEALNLVDPVSDGSVALTAWGEIVRQVNCGTQPQDAGITASEGPR